MTDSSPSVLVDTDEISLPLCRRMAAFLDRDPQTLALGDEFPLPWIPVLFPSLARQSEIGADGHARKGEFLPDLGLPRRRFAGRELELVRPMRIGDRLTRRSSVHDVTEKVGRSGPMAFVTLLHEATGEAGIAYREYQRIVYLAAADSAPAPPAPKPQPDMPEPRWRRTVKFGMVDLFRYSALTYNAHRIHYDRTYATEAEGYPGLVVHGPLIATLLLDLFLRERPGAAVSGFRFRALRPIFDGEPIVLGMTPDATGAELVAIDAAGGEAMRARVDV